MIDHYQKQFVKFVARVFSNFRLTLLAILTLLTLIYVLMLFFSSYIGDFVNHNEFLNFGFWGLGLLFFMFITFAVNVAVMIVNSFRPVERLRDLLYPILAVAFVVNLAFFIYGSTDSAVEGPLLYKFYITLWIAYFSFVPQAFIYMILPEHKPIKGFWKKVYYVVPRLALAAVIIFLVTMIHSELGRAFGITPD